MFDQEAVSLFIDLESRYPLAAAGLIEDLCSKLSRLLENDRGHEHAISDACETLAQIFRPMDRQQFRESYPWDTAYDRFGRWLLRGHPRHVAALVEITGWSDKQMAECKVRCIELGKILRDDWNRWLSEIDEATLANRDAT